MTNYFLKAALAEDPAEQIDAMRQFFQQELEDQAFRVDDLENDDGTIREGKEQRWHYEKGKLDGIRTAFGLVMQASLTQQARQFEDSDPRD